MATMIFAVPKETDPERLSLLLRLLEDTASNVVIVNERAYKGNPAEPYDIGLDRLFSNDMTRLGKRDRLKEMLVDVLRRHGNVNRIEYQYENSDPEIIYEFRFDHAGTKLYVKTELNDDDPDEPVLIIRSVKRQN